MRNDIIKYLQEEVYRRCKQPTNKFGMGCYCHIEAVVKNAEILEIKIWIDREVVIIAVWLQDIWHSYSLITKKTRTIINR